MNILGVGVDIVSMSRINAITGRRKERFAQRILSVREYAIYLEKYSPEHFIAKRFAAKEAVLKAMQYETGEGIYLSHIECLNQSGGMPFITLYKSAKKYAESKGIKKIHISLSDEKEYAIAYVICV